MLLDQGEDDGGGQVCHDQPGHQVLPVLLEHQHLLQVHLESVHRGTRVTNGELHIADGGALPELEAGGEVAQAYQVQLAEDQHPHPVVHPAPEALHHHLASFSQLTHIPREDGRSTA